MAHRPVIHWGAGSNESASLCLGVGLELFSMNDLALMKSAGYQLPTTVGERLRFLQTPSDLAMHIISREHGLGSPPIALVSACAAGTDAIGVGYRLVANGRRRFVLAGGTDSMINPLGVAGFCFIDGDQHTQPRAGARLTTVRSEGGDGFCHG